MSYRPQRQGVFMRKRCLFLSAVIFAGAALSPANAQVLSGSIVGQVVDTTGAGVPSAEIRLTHRQTNQVRTTLTSPTGEYSMQSLPGGTYDIANPATPIAAG